MQNRIVFGTEPRGGGSDLAHSSLRKEQKYALNYIQHLKWQDQVYISVALLCMGTVTSLAITSVSPLCHTITKQGPCRQWVSLRALKFSATASLDNLAGSHQPYLPLTPQAREQGWGCESGWVIHLLWLFSVAEIIIKWLLEPSINQRSWV